MATNDYGNTNNDERQVSGSHENQGALVVAVEGNIGSGKSTFLEYCRSNPGIDVYQEPVEKGTNVHGENLLFGHDVTKHPGRYAMAFQLQANTIVLDIYKIACWKPSKLIERSLLSSRYCFLENMRRTGLIEHVMGAVLQVYLRTSPVVAHSRVLGCARVGEGAIGGYILGVTVLPVYVIDANLPMNGVYAHYEECFQFLDLLNA